MTDTLDERGTLDALKPIGTAALADNAVTDAKIATHTSTKITITNKSQLNSNVVYTDQANVMGDFDFTLNDNRLIIAAPTSGFNYTIRAADITSDRILNLPLISDTDTIMVLGLPQTISTTKTFQGGIRLTDNSQVLLGTGLEARINYNAGQFTITPDAVGTSVFRINQDSFDLDVPTLTGARLFLVSSQAQIVSADLASGVFAAITGLGAQSQTLNMSGNTIDNVSSLIDNSANPSTDTAAEIRFGTAAVISVRNVANSGNLAALRFSDIIDVGVTIDMGGNQLAEPDIVDAVKVLGGFFGTGSGDATVGLYRAPNNNSIAWRNAANSADILFTLNASDNFTFGSNIDLLGNNIRNVEFLESNAANPADAGVIRLGNNELIQWRDSTDVANFEFGVNTSDNFFIGTGLDFGGNIILNVASYETDATNPANAGAVRLGNAELINWRNAQNDKDLELTVDSNNLFFFKTEGGHANQGIRHSVGTSTKDWRIINKTATSNQYFPNMEVSMDNDATYNFQLRTDIVAAADTGSVPIRVENVRLDTPAAVATRPLFSWQNNATPVMELSTTTLDIQNNNLVVGTGVISFRTTDASIEETAGNDMQFDVATSNFFDFRINDVLEYRFDTANANFNGNNIINLSSVSFDDANTSINQAAADLQTDVATGGAHVLRVNNISQSTIDVDALTLLQSVDLRLLDSNVIALGTGQDATLTYDGTNLIIDPQAVGTGFLEVQADIERAGGFKMAKVGKVFEEFFSGVDLNTTEIWNEALTAASSATMLDGIDKGYGLTSGDGSTGGTKTAQLNFSDKRHFDPQNCTIYGIGAFTKGTANSQQYMGIINTGIGFLVNQELLAVFSTAANTNIALFTNTGAGGTITQSDVAIGTHTFKIVSNGTDSRLYLLIAGVWVLKATISTNRASNACQPFVETGTDQTPAILLDARYLRVQND